MLQSVTARHVAGFVLHDAHLVDHGIVHNTLGT